MLNNSKDHACQRNDSKDRNVTAKIANAAVTNAKLDKAGIPLSGFGSSSKCSFDYFN
jgi:hypothetical protein